MEIGRLVVGPLRTNCYVLSDGSSCVIVDPGGDAQTIIDHLEERKIVPTMIVSTHGHFDHILAVNILRERYDIPFLVSRKDLGIIEGFTDFVKKYFGFDPGTPPQPDGNLEQGTRLKLGGESISVAETPGHTPGSCSLFADGIMLSGDFIFKGTIGRTDFGGSYGEMTASIRWVKKLEPNIKIYPGHGDATTLEDEIKNNPFFRDVLRSEFKGNTAPHQ